MAFDQSTIGEVRSYRDGTDLFITWTSTAPAGTHFQIYGSGKLLWSGTARSASVPWPAERTRFEVGTILASEADADLSASLPAAPNNRPRLAWTGGSYLADDLESFRIYRGLTAGGAVSYAAPVGVVTAYPQDLVADGFGLGGFGEGGFGASATHYQWTGGPLAPGTWNFGVKSVDAAGNEGTAATASVVLAGPPRPQAANAAGVRLTYTYSGVGTRIVTLNWLASPA